MSCHDERARTIVAAPAQNTGVININDATTDGIYIDNVGTTSNKNSSADKNGIEIAGAEGNGVFVGATDKSGFKGLGGKFARHSLMFFDADINSSARFTRLSTNKSVDVFYNPSSIMPNPAMQPLMQKVMQGAATDEEFKEFGKLWQERVERICKDPKAVVQVKEV